MACRTLRKVITLYDRKTRIAIDNGNSDQYAMLHNYSAHINHMVTSVEQVLRRPYARTANETEWRQYVGTGGLLHVTNQVFVTFMAIEKERQQVHTSAAARHHIEIILETAYDILEDNEVLRGIFGKIFTDKSSFHAFIIKQLYTNSMNKYISVANNSFRKRLLWEHESEGEQLAPSV